MLQILKKTALWIPLALVLAGCAAPEQKAQDPGVEDLNPGDRTVIEAPSRQQPNAGGVSERNI